MEVVLLGFKWKDHPLACGVMGFLGPKVGASKIGIRSSSSSRTWALRFSMCKVLLGFLWMKF